MSGAAEPWVQHFTVTVGEDELWASGKFTTARYARRDDNLTAWGLWFVGIFAIGLAGLGAFKLGLIDAAALEPVLFTAYLAFAAGAATYGLAVRRQYRAYYRAFARNTGTWHYTFDDSGITYKNDVRQSYLLWRAVNSVDDLGWAVVLPASDQAIFIPSRVIGDTAMRGRFVAECAARIKTAREAPKT